MIMYLLSKVISMVFGLLYPAYCSYKAIKDRDVREYVHWMMYWVVFAFFSFGEVFTDTLIGPWFPFYYEFKILFLIWILSPATRGCNFIYRRFIHPRLVIYEPEIDLHLAELKSHTCTMFYRCVGNLFSRITQSVTDTFWNTALRAGEFHLLDHLRRSNSLGSMRSTGPMLSITHGSRSADTSPTEDLDMDRYIAEQMQREGNHERMDFHTTDDDEFDLEYIGHSGSEDTEEAPVPKPAPIPVAKRTRTTTRRKKESGRSSIKLGIRTRGAAPTREVCPVPYVPQTFSQTQLSDSNSNFQPSLPRIKSTRSENEGSDDEFFECSNNTKDTDVNPAKKVHVKVVAKTVLQTFESPTAEKRTKTSSGSVPYSVLTKEALALASCVTPEMMAGEVQLRPKPAYGLTSAEKSKLRKSASDIGNTKPKSSAIFSSNSFRRVLHPFSSSKTLSRTHAPSLVKKSSSMLEDVEKKDAKK